MIGLLVFVLILQNPALRTFRGVEYFEDGKIWIVDYDTVEVDNIYYSPDNGITWYPVGFTYGGHYRQFFDVVFVNDTTGWVMGKDGLIFKTYDNCTSWQLQYFGGPKWWAKAIFVDENVGWFAGGDAFFGKTIDGGDSIYANIAILGVFTDFYGIAAFDDMKAWMAGGRPADIPGGQGYIIWTKDGGDHWSVLDSSTVYDYLDLFFINQQTGWVVGGTDSTPYTPIVKITHDGGATWEDIIPPGHTLRSVHFINEFEGWACGKYGTIIHTTNGGYTWEEQESGVGITLFALDFTDSLHGVIVGDSGVVLFTEDGGNTWSFRSPVLIEELPRPELSHQVGTNIYKGEISLPKAKKLEIYSISGRRIKILETIGGARSFRVSTSGVYFLIYYEKGKLKVKKVLVIR